MITPYISLQGKITPHIKLEGKLNKSVIVERPELEDLEITPSGEEQNFKSKNYYGFDNVKVKAVESEEIEIVPSRDTQIKEGMFNKVTVPGDDDFAPENIAKDKIIFGLKGTFEGKEETGNAKVTSKFTKLTFPATVTLPEAVGNWDEYPFEFVGEGVTENGNLLYRFGFSIYSTINGKLIQVDYTTSDGINFTNINGEQVIEFGSQIGFNPDMWDDKLGYFMQLGEKELEINDASYLFYSNARLDIMDKLLGYCKNVTKTNHMFYMCNGKTTLDLSKLDTSNVTNMSSMFQNFGSLTTLDLSNFNTSNVTVMNNMFNTCSDLKTINLSSFDTRKVTNVSGMFGNFKGTTLDLSNFDFSSVTNISSFLYNVKDLINLKSFKNLGKGYTAKRSNNSSYTLELSYSTQLTHESLLDVLYSVYDLNLAYNVANGGTLYRQSLKLGATNLAKLQATEEGLLAIAEAERKGWDVT